MDTWMLSELDPVDLVQGRLIRSCAQRARSYVAFVGGALLCGLDPARVVEVGRDARGPERVVADPGGEGTEDEPAGG